MKFKRTVKFALNYADDSESHDRPERLQTYEYLLETYDYSLEQQTYVQSD